ncbi:MAG: hypothetical protein Q9160_006225 [Pyrenula sp. 1 TL-2023]
MALHTHIFALVAVYAAVVNSQGPPPGTLSPLATAGSDCGFDDAANVVCINKYVSLAAVMPYHFNRSASTTDQIYTFGDTVVGNDTSFAQVKDADFIVFDQQRALEYLGTNPSYSFVFNVTSAVHEAPVYVPSQNLLYISQLAPPPGYLPQLIVDLNANPPTLNEFLSDPPVYAPNGGSFRNNQIIWGASGGNNSIGGTEQRVSLRTLDPATNRTSVLLNNYFGYYFNTIDDIAIHPITKDIYFTDPQYSWFNALTDTAPQLPAASYRFNPNTGATFLIDDTITQPNGLAFAPGGRTLYISDTGAVASSVDPAYGSVPTQWNQTNKRTIYAFDVDESGTKIGPKRSFYMAQEWVPDGLKVSAENLILTGSGRGVDIIDPFGQLIMRVQTNYTVQNFAWTGPELSTLWMMGNGGISKVEWNVRGQRLT